MKLEPRIERLEARSPDVDLRVDRIELHGAGTNDQNPAVSRFENGRWTPFERRERRL